ncbi:hypothetical protein NK6_547 [Bradyrhizobium diazoefficiens]|uniref:Uncharacterized protein n=1 Tax=Bradyrhizobium diazoefficiens TaxID=1355477 RepID=A0A0E4BKE3_9BRAD|nr:hypothetical protein NK6_547 [Bradyrhizobium diazoefficiens]
MRRGDVHFARIGRVDEDDIDLLAHHALDVGGGSGGGCSVSFMRMNSGTGARLSAKPQAPSASAPASSAA